VRKVFELSPYSMSDSGGPPAGSSGARGNDEKSNDNRNRRNRGSKGQPSAKFRGKVEELADHVYDTGGMRDGAEDFHRTTREIGEYIARTLKNAGEFRRAFDPTVLSFDTLTEPPRPTNQSDMVEVEIWKMEVKEYRMKKAAREELEKQAYAIVLGQCSSSVRDRLESSAEWSNVDETSDVMGLLNLIRSSLYSGTTTRQSMHNMQVAQNRFMSLQQTPRMSNSKYLELFQSHLAAYEHLGGGLGLTDETVRTYAQPANANAITAAELQTAKGRARDEYLGIRFLLQSDPNRYGGLVADVENGFTRGIKSYPETLTKAYDMLVNYVDPSRTKRNNDRQQQGLSFAQDGASEAGRGNQNSTRGRGGRGRGRGRGGNQDRDGSQDAAETANQDQHNNSDNQNSTTSTPYDIPTPSTAEGVVLTQRYKSIPHTWILADSCSSVDIFSSRHLLRGIHKVDTPLSLHCNAGTIKISEQGYLGDYPEPVWFHPDGIANILSLHNLTKHYKITMDSEADNNMTLHKTDGTSLCFKPSHNGLYHIDSQDVTNQESMWMLLTTVKEQARGYTRRQLREAEEARRMQNIMMHPSDQQLKDSAIKHLRNCPVTTESVRLAHDIFGPNLGSLKGKTVYRPSRHVRAGVDPVPPDTLRRHRNVTLAIDIMFVNKIPFLVTVSRNIRFVTVTDLANRQSTTVEKALHGVIKLYRHRGFGVTTILCDQEFECLRPTFPFLNTCGADEHVPEIERMIRTIKERTRSTYVSLPFRHIPQLMVKRLVANSVFWWNALPANNGVSTVHSPRYLLIGNELTYDKHVQLEFGAYVQTHEEHSNDMRHRTLGAVCLGPTGNAQGGHYFMSLTSGDRIVRHRWTLLPMPTEAINRVSQIGRQQRMPSTLTFSNRHGLEILDQLGDYIEDDHPDVSDDDSTYSHTSTQPDHDEDLYDDDHYDDSDEDTDDDTDSNNPDDSDDDDGDHDHDLNHDDDVHEDDDSSDDSNPPPTNRRTTTNLPSGQPSLRTNLAPEHPPTQILNPRTGQSDRGQRSTASSGTTTPTRQRTANAVTPGREHSSQGSTGVINEQGSHDTDSPHQEAHDSDNTDEFTPPPHADDHSESTGVNGSFMDHESPGVNTDSSDTDSESTGVQSDEEINRNTLWDQFQRAEAEGRQAAQQSAQGPTRRSQRAQTPNQDGHAFLTALLDTFDPNEHTDLFTLVTAQMTANKGVQVFGKKGEDAIEKELHQLLTRSVMHGVRANQLTHAQRRAALRYLMFLKEKRCGTIKGRGCADGRKQRLYKTKEETSSPTLSNEALFLSCLIDAVERRYSIVCDIPGAFMQAHIDELLHVKIDGAILEVLLRIEPSYHEYVTYENGKKVVYAELDKALYGALQSALLFWKKLSSFLVDTLEFTMNPYDSCVANKVINGKQCTIAWYVDDLKISHVDPRVVENIFAKLQAEYGKEAPLTVSRGKVHNYLGMQIDYSADGKVKFTMPTLVAEICDQLPKNLKTGPSTTPAANHLFFVREGAAKLSDTDADLFHRMTAQLLYLCKRARPDLLTAVAFLTTRVSSPDVDDMRKLGRCVRYLRRTSHYPLILEANCLRNIRWWVDASYAVHPDMRSHTGATMSLGKGSVYSISTRQKMNTRSSTEAELVGVNDAMSLILWTRHFLEAQGYTIKENVVYQDNESAMLLEKNGRRSSTKRTRHLEVRYFFVTDNVNRKKISIEYCPTGDMIADYFTKPLQGAGFRKLLKLVLNIGDDIIDSSPQECVGGPDAEGSQASQAGTDATSGTSNSIVDTGMNSTGLASGGPELAKKRSYADVVRSEREEVRKLTFSRKLKL